MSDAFRDAYIAWAHDAEDHAALEAAKDHARRSWKGRDPAELEELLADMETVHATEVCDDEREFRWADNEETQAAADHWFNARGGDA